MKDFLEEEPLSIRDFMIFRVTQEKQTRPCQPRLPHRRSFHKQYMNNTKSLPPISPSPICGRRSSTVINCSRMYPRMPLPKGCFAPTRTLSDNSKPIFYPPSRNTNFNLLDRGHNYPESFQIYNSDGGQILPYTNILKPIPQNNNAQISARFQHPTYYRRRADVIQRDMNPEMVRWLEDHLKWGALPPRFITSSSSLPSRECCDTLTPERPSCIPQRVTSCQCYSGYQTVHHPTLWNMSGIQPTPGHGNCPCQRCDVHTTVYPPCRHDPVRACPIRQRSADSVGACNIQQKSGSSVGACNVQQRSAASVGACNVQQRSADSVGACNVQQKNGASVAFNGPPKSTVFPSNTSNVREYNPLDVRLNRYGDLRFREPRYHRKIQYNRNTSSKECHPQAGRQSHHITRTRQQSEPKISIPNTHIASTIQPSSSVDECTTLEIHTNSPSGSSESACLELNVHKSTDNSDEEGEDVEEMEGPRPSNPVEPNDDVHFKVSDISIEHSGSETEQAVFALHWDYTDKESLLDRIKLRLSRISHWD